MRSRFRPAAGRGAPLLLALLFLALAGATFALACSAGDAPPLSEAAQRGRSVYMSVCIACHNADPALDGSLGPAIAGSSRALLEARVVHAAYPPGYVPKRDSKAMPAFPQLAGQIDDLHAWLTECCRADTPSGTPTSRP